MDTIKIQIDTNAEQASKSFEELGNNFKKVDDGAKDLRKEIKELKGELFKLTPGTKEYAKALQELGGKMNQLGDTTQELRVATGGLDTVFETTTRATASLAGGFTAAMGVVSLFGGDTEELAKTFVKLQAAMSIMKGLKEFAAFFKLTDRAIISMKAYGAQLGTATAENSAFAGAVTASTTAVGTQTTITSAHTAAQTKAVVTTSKMTEEVIANTAAVNKNSFAAFGLTEADRELARLYWTYIKELELSNAGLSQAALHEMALAKAVAAHEAALASSAGTKAANAAASTVLSGAETVEAASETASAAASDVDTAAKAANTAATGANTAATELNTAANVKNTASTVAGSSAIKKSFPILGVVKERLLAVKSVLAGVSATTWVVIGAIGAVIGFMTHLAKESKKVQEQFEETDKVQRMLSDDMDTLTSKQENLDKSFNKLINDYQKLGASQKVINKLTYAHYEALRKQAKATYDAEIELAKFYSTSSSTSEEWKKHNDLAEEAVKLLKQYEGLLNDLNAIGVPDWMLKLNDAQEQFTRQIERAVNRGAMTEGEGFRKQIDKTQKEIDEFNEMLDDWYSGDFERIQKANEKAFKMGLALSESDNIDVQRDILDQRLKLYTKKYEDYQDRMHRTATQTFTSNQKKSNELLLKQFSIFDTELDKLYKEYSDRMEAFSSLVKDSDVSDETAKARLLQWQTDFKKGLDTYVKAQKDAASKLELTKADFALFVSTIESKVNEFDKFMINSAFPFPPEIHENVQRMQQEMVQEASTFVRLNENITKLVKEGKITTAEYNEWLVDYINKYQNIVAQNAINGKDIIDSVLDSMDVTEEEKESLREFWSELFDFSNILPPDAAKAIEDSVTGMIDKQLSNIENQYETRMGLFESYWADKTSSWLQGGTDTSYWGDSASATYQKMQQQADDLYKLLHKEYEQEIQLLQEKMGLLDENSEAYAQYFAKLQELRQADADAQAAQETASLANMRQYGQNVMEMTGKFTDSISGLAGAMGSYYAEQAEQAKEMYGENSEEYKKYLKKEGNMKIAQVWTDAATGIMSAWATSEALGPIAGPILAAIQTATLLATATASTMQIKRQTNANASGGSSTANVGQLTDRVIMADAQNTDQTAQLNAQYNQGNMRVYVTQNDIENANNENRVAVTSNKF